MEAGRGDDCEHAADQEDGPECLVDRRHERFVSSALQAVVLAAMFGGDVVARPLGRAA